MPERRSVRPSLLVRLVHAVVKTERVRGLCLAEAEHVAFLELRRRVRSHALAVQVSAARCTQVLHAGRERNSARKQGRRHCEPSIST
eukprot:6181851-Pleurochrysis_carterae.AAC.3